MTNPLHLTYIRLILTPTQAKTRRKHSKMLVTPTKLVHSSLTCSWAILSKAVYVTVFLNSTTATHTTFRTSPKLLLNLLRKRQHRLLSKDQSRCPTITTFALLVLISLLQFDVFPSSLPPWSLLCLQILLWSLKPFLLR